LWRGGELIWQGCDANTVGLDGESKPVKIEWSVLKNRYDESDFEVSTSIDNASLEGWFTYKGNNLNDDINFISPKANTIKCKIIWQENSITEDQKAYFGTIPVTTAWVTSSNY